jgi:hypothetical protein
MYILIYYIPSFAFLICCFYGKMKEKIDKYKLEKISDDLVEIDNSEITTNSVRATCLVNSTSEIYELNHNNGIVPSIPLDNIIIEE